MNEVNIVTALSLLLQLTTQAAELTKLINNARSEGRDITDAELDALAGQEDEARNRLRAAIETARAQGR